jgi:CHAT domain-containing protein/Tfp pilus assembly protein PilF
MVSFLLTSLPAMVWGDHLVQLVPAQREKILTAIGQEDYQTALQEFRVVKEEFFKRISFTRSNLYNQRNLSTFVLESGLVANLVEEMARALEIQEWNPAAIQHSVQAVQYLNMGQLDLWIYHLAETYELTMGQIEEKLEEASRITEPEQREQELVTEQGSAILEMINKASAIHGEGQQLRKENKFDDALKKFHEALNILETLDSKGEEAVIHLAAMIPLVNDIGNLYQKRGNYREALRRFDQALDLVQKVTTIEVENDQVNLLQKMAEKSLGLITNNIGQVAFLLGEPETALDKFNQSLKISQEIEDYEDMAISEINIGSLHFYRGDYKKALESNNKAIGYATQLRKQPSPVEKVQKRLLDVAEQDMEKFRKLSQGAPELENSLKKLETSIQTIRKNLESEKQSRLGLHVKRTLGHSVFNIGTIYEAQGDYEAAKDNLETARDLYREINDQPGEGLILLFLGRLELARKDEKGKNLEQAETYFREAHKIFKALDLPAEEAGALNNLGHVYAGKRLYKQATKNYQEALNITEKIDYRLFVASTKNHLGWIEMKQGNAKMAIRLFEESIDEGKALQDQETLWKAYYGLGLTYEAQDKFEPALEAYKNAVNVIEEVRVRAAGIDEARASFIEAWSPFVENKTFVYEAIIRVLLTLYQQKGDEKLSLEALEYAERAKARAFLDVLAGSGQVIQNLGPEAREWLSLSKKVVSLARSLREEQSGKKRKEAIQIFEEEQENAKKRLAALEAHLSKKNPQFKEMINPTASVVQVSQIKGLLDENTAFIEYFITSDRVVIWVVRKKGSEKPLLIVKVTREALEQTIYDLRRGIKAGEDYQPLARKLYDLLVQPMAPEIAGVKSLLIIPHGILHYLPFQTLMKGDQYLIEAYAISYAPSMSVLKFVEDRAKEKGSKLLAVGNPKDPRNLDGTPMKSLPGAEIEAKEVSGVFPESKLFVGEKATKSQIKAESRGYTMLHFATHGILNQRDPLSSSLVLAHGENLAVHEIFGLDLKANLVTLSACETQLGTRTSGDELIGLTRAFIYAGTPSIITSLWRVEDAPTGELMKQFYKNVSQGMMKAEAMRKAQLTMIAEGGEAAYWAPFILVGDPR